MKFPKISKATITRLSRYSRALEKLNQQDIRVVSSEELARYCEVSSAQIRKDISFFGAFGVRGVGYKVKSFLSEIKKILSLNKKWHLGIIGRGNMGSALIAHSNFTKQGYHFVAAFDVDPLKVGKILPQGFPVSPLSDLGKVAVERDIEIAVISTPTSKSQDVVNLIVETPIRGILNFTPVQLHVPEGVIVHHIDFTVKLDRLAYQMVSRPGF